MNDYIELTQREKYEILDAIFNSDDEKVVEYLTNFKESKKFFDGLEATIIAIETCYSPESLYYILCAYNDEIDEDLKNIASGKSIQNIINLLKDVSTSKVEIFIRFLLSTTDCYFSNQEVDCDDENEEYINIEYENKINHCVKIICDVVNSTKLDDYYKKLISTTILEDYEYYNEQTA